METPYKEIEWNELNTSSNSIRKEKHVRFNTIRSKQTPIKKKYGSSVPNKNLHNIESCFKSKLHSDKHNTYDKPINNINQFSAIVNPIKTPLIIDNTNLRSDLFDSEFHSLSSRTRNKPTLLYDTVTTPLILSQKIKKDKPTNNCYKNKYTYSNTTALTERNNTKYNNYPQGKSVLFKLLHNSLNINNNASITNDIDLTDRNRHHHFQTYSLTERHLKIPKLDIKNDNSTFLNVIANLPKNTKKINKRNNLLLQNELRKLKTCDETLNNHSSSRKYNLKLSTHAITESFKKRVLKEVKIIQEDTKKSPLPKHCETDPFNESDIVIEQKEPVEEMKQFIKSKTKLFPCKNRKSFLFAKRKSLSIRPEIFESYGKTKLNHDNLHKEKMKSRLKVMDQQLHTLYKEDYENMKAMTNQQVNAKNLDRVVRFLHIIKFDHKQFMLVPNEEMEQPEKMSQEKLLNRDYITAKTLDKLGPAKYVKTQFKPKTIRKFFESKGLLMGNK